MQSHLKQVSPMITSLQRKRLMTRQSATLSRHTDFSDLRPLPRNLDGHVQLFRLRPVQDLIRLASPLQSKGRRQNGLRIQGLATAKNYRSEDDQFPHIDNQGNLTPTQGKPLKPHQTTHKKLRPGSILLEMTVAIALLSAIGLVVFQTSLDLLAPRQWVLHQNVSDAYITYEEALAARISFEEFTADNSPWPVFPDSTSTDVEIGKLPGGRAITGTVVRTRTPDPNNLTTAGGAGTTATNPAEMESWQLESHLTYRIGNETYVKSRTTVRTQ